MFIDRKRTRRLRRPPLHPIKNRLPPARFLHATHMGPVDGSSRLIKARENICHRNTRNPYR